MEAPAEDEKQPPSLEVGAFNLEEHSSNMAGDGQGADRIITETLQEHSSNMAGDGQGADRIITETLQELDEFSDKFQNMDMQQEVNAKWESTEDDLDKLKLKEMFQIQTAWMSETRELKAKYLELKDIAERAHERALQLSEENENVRRLIAVCEHQLSIHQRKASERLKAEKEEQLVKEDLERAMVEIGLLRSSNEQLQARYKRMKDEKETATKLTSYRKHKDTEILLRKKEVALKAAKGM